jgi:hypothetical protein
VWIDTIQYCGHVNRAVMIAINSALIEEGKDFNEHEKECSTFSFFT